MLDNEVRKISREAHKGKHEHNCCCAINHQVVQFGRKLENRNKQEQVIPFGRKLESRNKQEGENIEDD